MDGLKTKKQWRKLLVSLKKVKVIKEAFCFLLRRKYNAYGRLGNINILLSQLTHLK